jgi:hypothetical protein
MESELFFWLDIFGALFLWVKHHVAKLPGLQPYSIHMTKSHRFPVPRDAE